MIENYNALTVGDYEAIMRAQREHADDINGRNLAVLSILTGKSEEELLDLPLVKFRALMDKAVFLRRPLRPAPVCKSYKLGDMTLRVVADIDKMTTAQYIDYQEWAKRSEDTIAEILSCFLLPHGCRYNDGYDITEVQRAIREHLLSTEAHGLLAFFFKTSQRSMLSTLRSSAATLRRANKKKRSAKLTTALVELEKSIHSLRDGAGWRTSMPLLR